WMRTRMDGQAQSGQAFLDGSFPPPQGRCIGGKEQHVIDIPHVAGTAQGALDEVVEGVEIDIGPELTGQVANGQATLAQHGKQIVTGEIDHVIDLAQHTATALQDAVNEPEYLAVSDLSCQDATQDNMIDTGEKLAQVTLQHIGVLARQVLHTLE